MKTAVLSGEQLFFIWNGSRAMRLMFVRKEKKRKEKKRKPNANNVGFQDCFSERLHELKRGEGEFWRGAYEIRVRKPSRLRNDFFGAGWRCERGVKNGIVSAAVLVLSCVSNRGEASDAAAASNVKKLSVSKGFVPSPGSSPSSGES